MAFFVINTGNMIMQIVDIMLKVSLVSSGAKKTLTTERRSRRPLLIAAFRRLTPPDIQRITAFATDFSVFVRRLPS